MMVFTWIVATLAIIIFVAGIVSAIVVRTDVTPNWIKIRKILVWVIGLLVFRMLVWGIVNHYPKESSAKQTANLIPVIENKTVQYEWYWELPLGQFVRGKNKGGPFVAEINTQENGDLWVNVLYEEYGKKEVAKIRLGKIGDKSWEGPWEQNNPQDEGRCDLHEISPGVWSGTMTGKDGIPAFCKIIRKR
jgi:hypothetical protein